MLDQKKIMECADNVPSLSPTVTKIVQVANNVNASADDIIQVIKMDPVLTGKVLKLINSVYYGMPQKVVSLGRAVILLGINTIKNLALSTAVLGVFKQRGKVGDFSMNLFWEHCLGCAVGSKLLAKSKKVNKLLLEEYFIAGLLHDIGKIALVQFASEEYDKVLLKIREDNAKEELEAEEEILGTNHAAIGGLIADKWRLPKPLKESITEHHNPAIEEDEFSIKTAVYIANINCNRKNFGVMRSRVLDYNPEILEKTGLTEESLETILAPLEEEINLAKIFLKI